MVAWFFEKEGLALSVEGEKKKNKNRFPTASPCSTRVILQSGFSIDSRTVLSWRRNERREKNNPRTKFKGGSNRSLLNECYVIDLSSYSVERDAFEIGRLNGTKLAKELRNAKALNQRGLDLVSPVISRIFIVNACRVSAIS